MLVLPFFRILEVVVGIGTQGQGAAAGFCLGGIITNRTDKVVANLFLDNRSADVNPPGFKVDVGPAKSQGLGAAQAVEAGQKTGSFLVTEISCAISSMP